MIHIENHTKKVRFTLLYFLIIFLTLFLISTGVVIAQESDDYEPPPDFEPPPEPISYSFVYLLVLLFIINLISALALIIYELRKGDIKVNMMDSEIEEDKHISRGKLSYSLALLFFLCSPLTIFVPLGLIGGGLIIFLLIPAYPFVLLIPFVLGIFAKKTKYGKKGLLLSSILLIIAVAFALYLYLNPPYIT